MSSTPNPTREQIFADLSTNDDFLLVQLVAATEKDNILNIVAREIMALRKDTDDLFMESIDPSDLQ